MGLSRVYADIRTKRPSIHDRPLDWKPYGKILHETQQGCGGMEKRLHQDFPAFYERFKLRYRIQFPLNIFEIAQLIARRVKPVGERQAYGSGDKDLLAACLIAEDFGRANGWDSNRTIQLFSRYMIRNLASFTDEFNPVRFVTSTVLVCQTRPLRGGTGIVFFLEGIVRAIADSDGLEVRIRAENYVDSLRQQRFPEPDTSSPNVELMAGLEGDILRELIETPTLAEAVYAIYGDGRLQEATIKTLGITVLGIDGGSRVISEEIDADAHPRNLPLEEQPVLVAIKMDPFEADAVVKTTEIRARGVPIMEPVARIIRGIDELGIFRWIRGKTLMDEDPEDMALWEKFGSLIRLANDKGVAISDIAPRNTIVRPDRELVLIDPEQVWLTEADPLTSEERLTGLVWLRDELGGRPGPRWEAFRVGYGQAEGVKWPEIGEGL